ncbi:hypothetical protein [Mesorhizobium sp.]|uniref:hypothetical protein n=1 Tax=Mesorhizobium sp. TaxID=1871066 RepID=UPI0011F7E1BC|nr:hypothetical protein [Mesorhizobium sp.]TIS48102.1 MAG: hypothetical protein E5W96_20610 [Mesorhizobium sp.]
MNTKIVCISALAATVLAGEALAGALDEPAMMAPFFTDSSLKTMKSDDEMKKVWSGMPKSNQDNMMKECQDAAMSKPYAVFCDKLKALVLGGANK